MKGEIAMSDGMGIEQRRQLGCAQTMDEALDWTGLDGLDWTG